MDDVTIRDLEEEEEVARQLFLAEHPKAEWFAGRARAIWFLRANAAIAAVRSLPAAALPQALSDREIARKIVVDVWDQVGMSGPPWEDHIRRVLVGECDDQCTVRIALAGLAYPAALRSARQGEGGETRDSPPTEGIQR